MALMPDRHQGLTPTLSNSHRENRQLSSCSSHVPQPYPAKSAKFRGTAESKSAQINHMHSVMCPMTDIMAELLLPLDCGWARAEPARHTLHNCHRMGTRALHPKCQQPSATGMGTVNDSSCALLPPAPMNHVGKGCQAPGGWHCTLLCETSHS